MTDIADLERRVTALEANQHDTVETLRWVVAKLGRVSAVQDEHGLRLERIDGKLDKIENRLGKVEAEITSFRRDLPSIVADAVREGMKER
jgi:uncharacterized coiled-coil protein SlyX